MKKYINELYQINPQILNKKKICIFGTGIHAKQTYIELSQQGIKTAFFVDRYAHDLGASYMGLPLVDEDELKDLDASVIIASTSWEDISKRLIKQGITDIFVDFHRYGEISIQEEYLCSIGKYSMERDTLYILCPAGIGDTLYIAALAEDVKKYYTNVNKICLITKESHACISKLFDGVDEVIASNSVVESLDLYSIASKIWYLKNYIYGHFKKNLCQTLDIEWYNDADKNMLSFYKRKILRIPQYSKLEKMKLPDIDIKVTIPDEKAIIFMPYAVTVPLLSEAFWKDMAKEMRHRGYTVYTNIKDESEKPVHGTYPLNESIVDTASICEHAEAVIALRSGMCDILAMASVPLVVLNTDERCALDWDVTNIREDHIKNLQCYGDFEIKKIEDEILDFLEAIDG